MPEVTRKDKILDKIDINGDGLELGPLCWPVLTKDEANIKYVDHINRNELIEKYKNDNGVALDKIPGIDYPLNGRSLREAIPKGKVFDYVIASHVIEHVPDMIRWLQDISSILKLGGILSLAIPDKRYTFDIDRNTSTAATVVGAYIDNYVIPSSTMAYDYASEFRLGIDAKKVWAGELYLTPKARHRSPPQASYELCINSKKQYIDMHCYVFTPYSFFEILKALMRLQLIDFEVASFYKTAPEQYEFIVILRKIKKTVSIQDRLLSIPKIKRDSKPRELKATIGKLVEEKKVLQSELQATIDKLVKEKDELHVSLQDMNNSRSWRLTKPFRQGAHTARKIIRK